MQGQNREYIISPQIGNIDENVSLRASYKQPGNKVNCLNFESQLIDNIFKTIL